MHVDADTLFTALEKAENPSGDPNKVGDNHLRNKAHGLLQIRKSYLDDVNKIAGYDVLLIWGKTELTMEDMKDKDKARWVAKVYLTHYGELYEKRTGKAPTMEVYAKIHNGGPNGWRRGNFDTAKYWAKVVRLNGLEVVQNERILQNGRRS